jgi:tetratricopeptide (TPR) repeat protein
VAGLRIAFVVMLCGGLVPATSAGAETPEAEVERLANDAVNAYKGADYKRAVELLQKAYEIRQVPALLYNMAKAYDKLGDVEHAYDTYRLYADSAAAEPKLKAKAELRVAALAELRRKKKAEEKANETPPPPQPQQQQAQQQNAPPPVNLEPTLQPPPTPEEQRAHAHDEFVQGKKRDRLITIVLGGATVAFAAVAIGLSADALMRENKYHASTSPDDKSRLESEAKLRANVADGFWVGTAVAAGVTGYFAWRAFLRKEPGASASGSVALVPLWMPAGGGGIAAVGRF